MKLALGLLLLASCCPKGEHVTDDPKFCVGLARVCAPDVGEGEGK